MEQKTRQSRGNHAKRFGYISSLALWKGLPSGQSKHLHSGLATVHAAIETMYIQCASAFFSAGVGASDISCRPLRKLGYRPRVVVC